MSRHLTVAAVAHVIVIGDLEINLAAMRAAITQGLAAGARLIVLPELATSGYIFTDRDEALGLALEATDPRVVALAAEVPADSVAVFGICERSGDDLYNSAVVVSGGAVLAVYRKSHLWATEKAVFREGTDAGLIVETAVGRVGVAICYDNEFPEVPRRLALAGAEILALPVNWPLVERPEGEHAPEIIQSMAAARSSRLATVVADRHGSERGVAWTGGTVVISGDGWIEALPDEGGLAITELELLGHTALGEHNDLFADRRPDLYHPVPPSTE